MAERAYGPRKAVDPDFGPALKAARLERGLSRIQAAERARISPNSWRDVEQGRWMPGAITLERIQEALRPPADREILRALGRCPTCDRRIGPRKRTRNWRPTCPRCMTNVFVVKLPAGYFCQNPGRCFWFLPPEVVKPRAV